MIPPRTLKLYADGIVCFREDAIESIHLKKNEAASASDKKSGGCCMRLSARTEVDGATHPSKIPVSYYLFTSNFERDRWLATYQASPTSATSLFDTLHPHPVIQAVRGDPDVSNGSPDPKQAIDVSQPIAAPQVRPPRSHLLYASSPAMAPHNNRGSQPSPAGAAAASDAEAQRASQQREVAALLAAGRVTLGQRGRAAGSGGGGGGGARGGGPDALALTLVSAEAESLWDDDNDETSPVDRWGARPALRRSGVGGTAFVLER